MNDYISREAALIVLDWDCTSQDALDAIKAIPAADVVEVRHGRWENLQGNKYHERDMRILRCSLCRNFLDMSGVNAGRGDANYCPSCGAKMDGWKWCVWQDEDNEGVYCTAHIHEDRVLNCPYKNLEERQRADYPCQDYRPMDGGQDDV